MLRTREVSLPELQRRVGHESITTTIDTYGLMVDDVSAAALDALDQQLTGRVKLKLVADV